MKKKIEDLTDKDAIKVTKEEYPKLAVLLNEAGQNWGGGGKFTTVNPWTHRGYLANEMFLHDIHKGIVGCEVMFDGYTEHLASDFFPDSEKAAVEQPDQRSIYFSFFDKLPKEYADACKKRYDEGRLTRYLNKELNCVANAVWNLSWVGDLDYGDKIYKLAEEIDAANVSDAPESEEEKLRKIYFDFYDNLNINGERIDQYYIDVCKENWDYEYAEEWDEPEDQAGAVMWGNSWRKSMTEKWWSALDTAIREQDDSSLPKIPTTEKVQSEQPSAYSINIDESTICSLLFKDYNIELKGGKLIVEPKD